MAERTEPVLFVGFSGLRNTVTPERLSKEELALALDIDLDDANQIHRRRGRTKVASGNFHSLHKAGGAHYVVKDEDLCRLYPDYSTAVLQAGVGPERLSYVDVGEHTFFASSNASGVIEGETVSAWGQHGSGTDWESPVVNPTSTLPEVAGHLTGPPPMATSLAYLNGRIYLAEDRVIWATELFRYHTVDRTRNYLYFEDPITGMHGVGDGLYVGTTKAVYFLSGEFRSIQRRQVHYAGMVPGSMVAVDPEALGGEQAARAREGVMFLTHTGLCVGLDSGVCYNLTEGVFELPDTREAAAMFRDQDGIKQYVGVTQSSGEPTHTARFGDRVDVEIRRFKGVSYE